MFMGHLPCGRFQMSFGKTVYSTRLSSFGKEAKSFVFDDYTHLITTGHSAYDWSLAGPLCVSLLRSWWTWVSRKKNWRDVKGIGLHEQHGIKFDSMSLLQHHSFMLQRSLHGRAALFWFLFPCGTPGRDIIYSTGRALFPLLPPILHIAEILLPEINWPFES